MTVRYHTRRGVEVPDYQCQNRCIQDGAARCQTIPGAVVDNAVGTLLLDTLSPHALEVALTVQAELDTRAAEADALRRQAVERARHRADLARRRYLAVDPDNRLVADSLEADWNDALRALQAAREDYERASAAATAALTDQIKHQIHSLATDFPALWSNPHTAQRDRKRMVRLLVADVTLHKTDRIHLHVRLRGGQTHSLAVAIPPTSWQARQTRPDTVAALDRLLDAHTDAEAADALNADGHRSGENKPFTAGIIVHVRHKYHLPSHAERLRAQGLLTTTELAQRLRVHPSTVKSWANAGILNSHKANDKNERLYEPPIDDDPRLTVRQGSPLTKRVLTQPTTRGAL
jgi:DNA-binding transcriptional regulator YiaG